MKRWEVLYDLIVGEGYKTFVEVGVAQGYTSGYLLDNIPDLKVYAVDPYPKRWVKKEAAVLSHERCYFLETTSSKALGLFEDNLLDIVFIDGNHKYSFAHFDICKWWEKVRVGGILAGHDYNASTVRKAVNRFCSKNVLNFNLEQDNVWWIKKCYP